MKNGFSAVLFDLGGVVLGSPLHAIRDFEVERGVLEGTINRHVAGSAPDGAWHRLERGELGLGPEFFSLWSENPRLLPHVHLPLQSGCDETLRRMARRTDQASFRALVNQARQAVPELSITTDIIVGFPGESDVEFEASVGFVEEMEFAKLHVFRYSPREGTAAATMSGRVPPLVAQQRSNRMHALGAVCEAGFKARFIGRTVPVLWEQAEPRPECVRWSGLTGNYIRVVTDTGEDIDLGNEITETTLISELPGAMLARISDRLV